VVADKAWDEHGQLWFNIFNTDGFLGDRLTVNWHVEAVLRGARASLPLPDSQRLGVALLKIALGRLRAGRRCRSTRRNDGNLMEHDGRPSTARCGTPGRVLPEQAIAERYDIVDRLQRIPRRAIACTSSTCSSTRTAGRPPG
jgi:hypothetical protein